MLKQTCSICLEEYDLVAYAKCRHFMCIACCWTLRDIVEDFKCPICRFELPWAVLSRSPFPEYENEDELIALVEEPNNTFSKINQINLYGTKYDIDIATSVRAPQCTQCKISFDSVYSMSNHLNNEHRLKFCYVCIEYLKKLPKDYELFKSYELTNHLRMHPKCVLCEKYVLNENALRAHRKTNHFQCEVCDQSHEVSVFNSHIELTDHFQQYHFLCEYGECGRFRLTVFGSKIEYHRHLSNNHASLFTKEKRKQLLNFSNDDFMKYSQPNNSSVNVSSELIQLNSDNRSSSVRGSRNIIDVVNEMRIAENQVSTQHSLVLNDVNFPHLNISSRRIEADLPLLNPHAVTGRPLDNILNGSVHGRNAYPTIEPSITTNSTNNDFPSLPSSTVSNNIKPSSSLNDILPSIKTKTKKVNNSYLPVNPQEDFPSFPLANTASFHGKPRFWDKTPKCGFVKKPKYQPTTIAHHPPTNALAYSLGLRNLDVTTDSGAKQKKKNKTKPFTDSINLVNSANSIKSNKYINGDVLDREEFPALNSVKPPTVQTNNIFQENIVECSTKDVDDESLFDLVKKACKNNEITLANFMQLCANFARGQLGVSDFHKNATEAIGDEQLHKILPKLAEEMPDESKSKALFNLLKKNSPKVTSKSKSKNIRNRG